MLGEKGFDLWADGYDQSVGMSDEDGAYPFAGYKLLLNEIFRRVLAQNAKTVLDIGFGTGVLTAKLYERDCDIWGQDFSANMIALAREKMPSARLYQGDFSQGLAGELLQKRYDAIISTYAIHHLTDVQKAALLQTLLPLLNDGGRIYIGDVAFRTRADMAACKALAGEEWDEEEIYMVADEVAQSFPQITFEPFSFCAGLFSLQK